MEHRCGSQPREGAFKEITVMSRRTLLSLLALGGLGAGKAATSGAAPAPPARADALDLPDAEWQRRLTAEQYRVLRREGTEAPFSSKLNGEKRRGTYKCVACDLPLFASSMKFDSGTGWPSFFETLPGAFGFRTDYKLILPRTEYHCSRCGGHHGHVFDDGPRPTGKRYCNNGVCLSFEPEVA
jgi:peptide-methionine (R)-S-oxide reductase